MLKALPTSPLEYQAPVPQERVPVLMLPLMMKSELAAFESSWSKLPLAPAENIL